MLRRLGVFWIGENQVFDEVYRHKHLVLLYQILQRQIHKVDLRILVLEMAHCAVGIQDFDQTLDCQVFSFLIDRSGFISAYFPKLFQVKVLGCINLGRLSFHIILCLSFWPLLFFLKNCRKFVRFILISTFFILYVFLSSLILFEFKERLEGTLGEFLQKIDPFLVILTIWHQLDVVPECFQNFRTHKWTQILNDGEGRTHNIIMLLICTFPNLADQSLTQRV